MAAKKIGKFIFRKIRGKVRAIRIKNERDPASGLSFSGVKERKITATTKSGRRIGQLSLQVPKKGKHATVLDVRVDKEFRRKGISRALFKKAAQFSNRVGKDFLRSDNLKSAAQVKIRRGFGKSVFIGDQFGRFGEQTRKISSNTAIRIIKENHGPNSKGRLVTGTTRIKKPKRKKR